MGISLKASLLRMGLSSLLLGTLLFSYVTVGCFSPIVIVEDQSVDVRDVGDGFFDEAVNGTDDDSEGSTDDSDEEAVEDYFQDLVVILEGNKSEEFTKFDSNEDETNPMDNIEDSEDIGE